MERVCVITHKPPFVEDSLKGIPLDIYEEPRQDTFMSKLTTSLRETNTLKGNDGFRYGVFLVHPHADLVERSTGLVLQHLHDRYALFFSSVAEELDFYPMGGLVPNIVFLHEEFLRARWVQILTRLMIEGDSLKAALSNSCREPWKYA